MFRRRPHPRANLMDRIKFRRLAALPTFVLSDCCSLLKLRPPVGGQPLNPTLQQYLALVPTQLVQQIGPDRTARAIAEPLTRRNQLDATPT